VSVAPGTRVGPILEAERVAGLRALSEAESGWIAVELLWPMAPIGGGDAGEGLVRIQAALRRLAEAPVLEAAGIEPFVR